MSRFNMTDQVVTRATLHEIEVLHIADDCPDTSYLEQEDFEERLQEYNNGDFGFIGIQARATILIPRGDASVLQEITSPGLWGIEDDSDSEYFREIAAEELESLKDMLESLNVDTSNFEELAP